MLLTPRPLPVPNCRFQNYAKQDRSLSIPLADCLILLQEWEEEKRESAQLSLQSPISVWCQEGVLLCVTRCVLLLTKFDSF